MILARSRLNQKSQLPVSVVGQFAGANRGDMSKPGVEMNILNQPRPPGWSQPKLPSFLEILWANTIGTFANKLEAHRLCRIDDLMSDIASDWKSAAPTIEDIGPLVMFFRAHSAFRGACGLGMGGMTVEGMAVLRLSLEFAGCACLLNEKPALTPVWWDRDVDQKSRKRARKEFTAGAIIRAVKRLDQSLGEIYEMLYDLTIQFGAHPNEKTVTQSLHLDEAPTQTILEQVYLQADGLVLDHWIRTSNQIGSCVLKVFEHLHHERFKNLNVRSRIETLAQGL
jgi:hypothetical protein